MSECPCHSMAMSGAMSFGYLSAFLGSPWWVFPAMALGAYLGYRLEKWQATSAAQIEGA